MVDTVNQPTAEPTRKTKAALAGGGAAFALSVVVSWLLRAYTHVEVPAEVQVAIAVLATAGSSYFTPEQAP